MNQRACLDRLAPQPGPRAGRTAVPTQCPTAATRARQCTNVRVLIAWPRRPGCVPAAPTNSSTTFVRTVDGKKFATRATQCTHARVLIAWPHIPYCSELPARGRTWREVKRTTEIPQHQVRNPRGNIEHRAWGLQVLLRCVLDHARKLCASTVVRVAK